MTSCFLLFASAFLAATIFPAQSEAVLVGMIAAGEHSPWLLVAVATAGNTLGAATNWLLGIFVHRFRDRRWFPASEESLLRAEAWYRRWGRWSLLLSWVPVVGDPITVVAGVLKEPFFSFILLTLTGKLARYAALAGISIGIFG